MLEFEWDENKSQANIEKHGISFERAKTIFDYPTLTRIDEREEYDEIREVSVGLMEGLVVIVAVHTDRDEKIRIISARPANRRERNQYYGFTQGRKDH